jgi:putative SOS response-associated peptidase YedK
VCGRFTLTTEDVATLARLWTAELDEALRARWRPRFNVAPGDAHLLVVARGAGRRLSEGRFGLAGPGGKLLINARSETAAEKPAFRDAWRARRAAVPADGFYEWTGPAAARRPSWLHPRAGGPILLAALWGPSPGGGTGFAILTTAARGAVAALHDRMPVVLSPSALDAWLSGGDGGLPPPAEDLFLARPVSARVNSVANDDPACLAPPDPERQGRLF